jgi:replication fork protection complex subunit Tof1/Swi1
MYAYTHLFKVSTTNQILAVKPDTDERRKAMFKNNKLRLLMKLVGFQPETDDGPDNASWVIPPSVSSSKLTEALESIQRYEAEPPSFENGQTAEDFIRRKSAARPQRAERSSDNEDSSADDSDADGDTLFPANGPTPRRRDWADEDRVKRRRQRRQTGPLTDAEREARREAREEANRRQQSKIKSNLYVHASDDESNEERDRIFFAKEEERRKVQARKAAAVMRPELSKMAAAGGFSDDSEDSDDGEGFVRAPPSGARARRKRPSGDGSGGEEGAEAGAAPQKRRKKVVRQVNGGPVTNDSHMESDSDGAPTPQEDDILGDDEELADAPQLSRAPQPGDTRPIPPATAVSMLESSFSLSSPLPPTSSGAAEITGDEDDVLGLNQANQEEANGEDVPVRPRRARTRGGFIIDSDSE